MEKTIQIGLEFLTKSQIEDLIVTEKRLIPATPDPQKIIDTLCEIIQKNYSYIAVLHEAEEGMYDDLNKAEREIHRLTEKFKAKVNWICPEGEQDGEYVVEINGFVMKSFQHNDHDANQFAKNWNKNLEI